jgi:hypothetical protein
MTLIKMTFAIITLNKRHSAKQTQYNNKNATLSITIKDTTLFPRCHNAERRN